MYFIRKGIWSKSLKKSMTATGFSIFLKVKVASALYNSLNF